MSQHSYNIAEVWSSTLLSVKANVCSVRVFDMFQHWALQSGACLADKVESSRVVDYVALCLSSIVVYEHLWMVDV